MKLWPFRKAETQPPPPVEEPTRRVRDHAQAEYRAFAIARDIEQRREEGRDKNRDHDAMVAEAMSLGYALVAVNKWTHEEVQALWSRLWP